MAISRSFVVCGLAAAAVWLAAACDLTAQLQPPLFEVATYPVTGIGPLIDVDIADVDADGLTDIGVLGNNGGYRVLLGRGEGLFFSPLDSPVGSAPWSATLADVTSDGRADRLLVDWVSIRVQASVGNGQFQHIGTYALGGCFGFEVHVADLNGDSLPDMATSWGDSITCSAGITTYVGDGQGLFHDQFSLIAAVDVDMQSLAPADLDDDGDLDLAGNSTGGTVGRFLGAGDGTFGQVIAFPTEGVSADVADVDADGWPDVLSVFWGGNLQVYRGTGQGAFAPALSSPGAPDIFQAWEFAHFALGDFNADGHVDAAGSMAGQLLISLGTGSGLFEPAQVFIAVPNAGQVRAADVNGDGSPDLVVGGGSVSGGQVSVLLNDRPAWPWSTVAPGLAAAGLEAPKLSASGSIEAGDPLAITLQQGASGAPAALIAGPGVLGAPFKGGVLVPLPAFMLPFVLDPAGGFALAGKLPAPLPSGAKLYLQTWIVDAAGPAGFTSSNAIVGTAP